MGTNWDMPPAQEPLEVEYKKALEGAVNLARRSNEAAAAQMERDEDTPEQLQEIRNLDKQVQESLARRVELLRAQPDFKTIEDAYPNIRVSKEMIAMLEEFDAWLMEQNQLVNKQLKEEPIDEGHFKEVSRRVKELRQKMAFRELDGEEWQRFNEATEQLARQAGYEIDPRGGQFIKGDLRIQVTNSPYPAVGAVGGTGRIWRMYVWRGRDENSKEVFSYDRGLDVACEDPAVQKEIDKLVALFG